jgi:asparagine synthase (glutamine-hydrolysing)
MTALAGLWSFDERPVGDAVPRMLAAQAAYGQVDAAWSDGAVGLGRRIWRFLPEDRHDRSVQVARDGALVLAADVRLDNRDELAAALGLAATDLPSLCDAALLLRALAAWDEGAVDRLLGDFAFALWDGRRQRLLLARDFLGQRPLHFARQRGFVAVASMPKGLHALPDIPIAPSRDAMAAFLALMPETGTDTFFEGIEKVPAGHIVIIDRSETRRRRYWDPAREVVRRADPDAYGEAIRAELDRAVRARLRRGDGPLGAHLSAGLDSGAVAATAARLSAPNGRVIAYTAAPRPGWSGPGPPARLADEAGLAADTAALYPNIEHVRVSPEMVSPLAGLDRSFALLDRPLLNACNTVWWDAILDRARRDGVDVLLTGQAGNMSFSYDGVAALPWLARRGRWLQLIRLLRAMRGRGARHRHLAHLVVAPLLPRPGWRLVERLRGRSRRLTDHSAIRAGVAATLEAEASARHHDWTYQPRHDPFEQRLWALRRVDNGNYNKGAVAGWGIDLRDPTADRRLVELCLSIPPAAFFADGVPRALARRMLADRLPPAVCRNDRKGYQAADWYEGLTAGRGELRAELGRAANVPLAADLIDLARLEQLQDAWPDAGWETTEVIDRYRFMLLRGAAAAHFIRRASRSNA